MAKMPAQKPGKSKQDYTTPQAVITAVERWLFGGARFTFDLAASEENAKAPDFLTAHDNALATGWDIRPNERLWLNPPYGLCGEFAAKCRVSVPRLVEQRATIVMLTPASIGTNWFAEHVIDHALVVGLRPRISFEGTTDPYPKDLMLTLWGVDPRFDGRRAQGFDCWSWQP
jgi:phage N-6-adenine-methyltransferase